MLKKIIVGIILILIFCAGSLCAFVATHQDLILQKFNEYVENTTGAPLISDSSPQIVLFPKRSLELNASTWQSPDGTMSISFSHATVRISTRSLLSGHFRIKTFALEDLDVTIHTAKGVMEFLSELPALTEKHRDLDEVIAGLLKVLNISPDHITISRGRIRLIQPDDSILTLAPFSLNASDIHPGTPTDLNLHTVIKGSAPAFEASADIRCAAMVDKNKASLTVAKALFTPVSGISFTEPLQFSGGIVYDFSNEGLSLSQLHFQGPEISVTASGSIASLPLMYRTPQQGNAAFTLEVTGDPQRLGKILGYPLPFADHNIFSSCALAAEIQWKNGKAHLSRIHGNADALTFSGQLDASFHPLVLQGSLNFGDLSLDDYRRESQASVNPSAAKQNFAEWPRLNLVLSAEHLRWNRLHLEQVQTRLSGQNGSYEFNPLTAILAGSPLTASMKTVLLPGTPPAARATVNISAPQINLHDLSLMVAKQPLLSGTGAINTTLSFTTSRGIQSLNGKGSLTSSHVQTEFSIVPPNLPLPGLLGNTHKFDQLFCSFAITNGRIAVDRLTLEAPRLALSGSGFLDIAEQYIDASGSIRIANTSVLPVRLEGQLHTPHYSLEQHTEKEKDTAGVQLNLELPQINKILPVTP